MVKGTISWTCLEIVLWRPVQSQKTVRPSHSTLPKPSKLERTAMLTVTLNSSIVSPQTQATVPALEVKADDNAIRSHSA